jgi:hypothetical protein
MAVHFCPVFWVSSRTTSPTNRSNSSVPGAASGPRIEQLSESASALKRTASPITVGWPRRRRAVAADPVKAMVSCPVRWSSRSPTAPQSSWTDPGGSAPDSTRCRKASSVTYAVWVAGLTIAGTPASTAGASFSSIPQTGKLKASMNTATPGREV